MNKLIISLLVAISCVAFASASVVKPEKKLYFTIPLSPPAAAAATTAAATTAAATTAAATTAADSSDTTAADSSDTTTAASSDTTTAASTDTTTAAASAAIQVIPLGQLLGYLFQGTFIGSLLQGIFGTTLPDGSSPTALSFQPLFQAIGSLFG